jgi:uncharacterized Zn finger protein (UPF0148 family)
MANSSTVSQRSFRANCPGCGAPLEFKSAGSTHAVCGYCATTVVRDGESLQNLGKLSALFEDYSPLQLGATGSFQQQTFTVVGRLQYAWSQGLWNEWYCWFDKSLDDPLSAGQAGAWLSEDNGQLVWMQAIHMPSLPAFERLTLNQTLTLADQRFDVAALTQAHLASGQGELPKIAPLNQAFNLAELRNAEGEILSLDYSDPQKPSAYRGSAVSLPSLNFKGLRQQSGAEIKGGRQFACPQCGASIALKLEQTRSLSCPACQSVIDTSQGIGKEVVSAQQDEPIQPTLALGTNGKLLGTDWQIVGYVSMIGKDASSPDESFGWEEYLLYNHGKGFAFLADSQEGWSLSTPLTGSAKMSGDGSTASYLGANFRRKEAYLAEVSYVAGEFYWQVQRGAQTNVTEFAAKSTTLLREQAASEVTWSRSESIDSALVAQAFAPDKAGIIRQDVKPVSGRRVMFGTLLVLVVFVFIVLAAVSQYSAPDCDPDYQNCASYGGSGSNGVRGVGGSYGGSSGASGGHK